MVKNPPVNVEDKCPIPGPGLVGAGGASHTLWGT